MFMTWIRVKMKWILSTDIFILIFFKFKLCLIVARWWTWVRRGEYSCWWRWGWRRRERTSSTSSEYSELLIIKNKSKVYSSKNSMGIESPFPYIPAMIQGYMFQKNHLSHFENHDFQEEILNFLYFPQIIKVNSIPPFFPPSHNEK